MSFQTTYFCTDCRKAGDDVEYDDLDDLKEHIEDEHPWESLPSGGVLKRIGMRTEVVHG